MAARSTQLGINTKTSIENELFSLRVISIDVSLPKIELYLQQAINETALLIFYGHGLILGPGLGGYNPTPIEQYEGILHLLDKYHDDLWIAKLGEIIKYLYTTNQQLCKKYKSQGCA